MKRALFVGFDPATVDFSDPALPPGMTAEKDPRWGQTSAGRFRRAALASPELLHPNPTRPQFQRLKRFVAGDVYDCVVIGAGVRLPRNRLVLFEDELWVRLLRREGIDYHNRPTSWELPLT